MLIAKVARPRSTGDRARRPFPRGRQDHHALAVSGRWQYPAMTIETTTETETAGNCGICDDEGECSNCDGTGEGSDGRDCGRCGGSGFVVVEHCCVCEWPVGEHNDYTCGCED